MEFYGQAGFRAALEVRETKGKPTATVLFHATHGCRNLQDKGKSSASTVDHEKKHSKCSFIVNSEILAFKKSVTGLSCL